MARSSLPDNMKTEVKRTPSDLEGGLQLIVHYNTPCAVNGWNPIAACVLGTGNGNRVGKRIFIRYFKFKISLISLTNTYNYEPIRICIVADKKANPTASPANLNAPYFPFGNRTPVDVTNNAMEWNNIINTEDWVVYSDKLYSLTAVDPVINISKTVKIFKHFEYADS